MVQPKLRRSSVLASGVVCRFSMPIVRPFSSRTANSVPNRDSSRSLAAANPEADPAYRDYLGKLSELRPKLAVFGI